MKTISLREQALQGRIMSRVYGAWVFRRAVRNGAKLVILFGLAFVAKNDIWYAQVFQNLRGIEGGFQSIGRYAMSAFLGTEGLVQLAVVLGLAIGAVMLWDVGKTVANFFSIAASRQGKRVHV